MVVKYKGAGGVVVAHNSYLLIQPSNAGIPRDRLPGQFRINFVDISGSLLDMQVASRWGCLTVLTHGNPEPEPAWPAPHPHRVAFRNDRDLTRFSALHQWLNETVAATNYTSSEAREQLLNIDGGPAWASIGPVNSATARSLIEAGARMAAGTSWERS